MCYCVTSFDSHKVTVKSSNKNPRNVTAHIDSTREYLYPWLSGVSGFGARANNGDAGR